MTSGFSSISALTIYGNLFFLPGLHGDKAQFRVISLMKKFSSPKIKIWFEPMFFSGFFCGFERFGSAAFPNFREGNSSPPQAAKCVRTNSRILHQKVKVKEFWFASLRSATNLYSILGVKTNSRFRKIWFEPMFFRNVVIPERLGEESRLAA